MRNTLTVLAVVVLLALIGGGAVHFLNTREEGEQGNLAEPAPSQEEDNTAPEQPDWCPRVEFISAPGTWESAADDDPINPGANPNSFMLSITNPLKEAYVPEDVKVWTLPYTAQFKNINAQHEMSYDDSRNEGTSRLEGELTYMHETCPDTKFILSGFSQGAVIAGDVADRIGGGNGPIPAESVAGVALIADGRRQDGVGINPGAHVGGVGAEIALQPVSTLIQGIVPGATMRGARANGFGELADRTFQICAPNDSICDAPLDVSNGLERARDLIDANGVHALYAYNPDVIEGVTTNQWVTQWAKDTIDAQ
ncbi:MULTISPECIES: cutinase family protein [Corynebacterium]|uniref:Cutinase family protein n=1 Tax=Corynebacterium aurimucosum TaxID=169292 RepID=A0A6I3KDB1_9CORY|nr:MULTISPECIES: cutinase family protein [Corynebacterium]MTD92259.1 cutinase family protein [Corynebacterium aurimucosum]OFK65639.1 carbohydrate esterase [Corynebacterium sp. HMSC076G08]OFN34933.1 carbohydrate esterase [Corynebacterium sp. HMSC072A04]OFO23137.1 carbohydrate esterase [Corynebacterium sp. HMSC056F09]OFO99363.1 carbohydrate esterase [Corynebacterium sp. HMSC034H07]